MGYFEDTDFAMTVRASGLKVLLQPLAVVYHQVSWLDVQCVLSLHVHTAG